jgi:hypothetical protein
MPGINVFLSSHVDDVPRVSGYAVNAAAVTPSANPTAPSTRWPKRLHLLIATPEAATPGGYRKVAATDQTYSNMTIAISLALPAPRQVLDQQPQHVALLVSLYHCQAAGKVAVPPARIDP